MHIKHNSFSFISCTLSLTGIRSHFNPFCLEFTLWPTPLPPRLATNSFYTVVPQLLDQSITTLAYVFLRDWDLINENPSGVRYPLCCEALNIFDGMI